MTSVEDRLEKLRDTLLIGDNSAFLSSRAEEIFFFIGCDFKFNPLPLRTYLFVTNKDAFLFVGSSEFELIAQYIPKNVQIVIYNQKDFLLQSYFPVEEIKTIIRENKIISILFSGMDVYNALAGSIQLENAEYLVKNIANFKSKEDIDLIKNMQHLLFDVLDLDKVDFTKEDIHLKVFEALKIRSKEFDSLIFPLNILYDKITKLSGLSLRDDMIPRHIVRAEMGIRKGIYTSHVSVNWAVSESARKNLKKFQKMYHEALSFIKPGKIGSAVFKNIESHAISYFERELEDLPGLPLGFLMPGNRYIAPNSTSVIKEGDVFYFQIFININKFYSIKEGRMIVVSSEGGVVL